MDDMEVPGVGCFMHILQLAVHKGLLSQCSITDSPADTKKMVGQCCSNIFRIRKNHMNVYTLFHQKKNKTLLRNSLDAGPFSLNAAVLSRKILVKPKYRLRTRNQHLLNIE